MKQPGTSSRTFSHAYDPLKGVGGYIYIYVRGKSCTSGYPSLIASASARARTRARTCARARAMQACVNSHAHTHAHADAGIYLEIFVRWTPVFKNVKSIILTTAIVAEDFILNTTCARALSRARCTHACKAVFYSNLFYQFVIETNISCSVIIYYNPVYSDLLYSTPFYSIWFESVLS